MKVKGFKSAKVRTIELTKASFLRNPKEDYVILESRE